MNAPVLLGTDSPAHRLMKFAERKARRIRGRFSGSGDQVSSAQLLGAFCQIAHDAEIQTGTQTQALHASSLNVCRRKCACRSADNETDWLRRDCADDSTNFVYVPRIRRIEDVGASAPGATPCYNPRSAALSEPNPSNGAFHGIFPFGPLGSGPSSRARCDAHGMTGKD